MAVDLHTHTQLLTEVVKNLYPLLEMDREIHITDIIQVHIGYSCGPSFSHAYNKL